jgi:hypothetical protein
MIPGMSTLAKGFSEVKYDEAGNMVIDLSEASSLIIKPDVSGAKR